MKNSGWIISPSPFIQTRPTAIEMTRLRILCLLPVCAMLLLDRDYHALTNILLCIAGNAIADLCAGIFDNKVSRKHTHFILSGLITALMLPSTYPPFMAFGVSFVGFFFAEAIFGGMGAYWINPAAVSVAIAYIGNPSLFPGFLVSPESIRTVGDAFGALRLDSFTLVANDQTIAGSLNSGVLSFFDIRIPEGYITLFWRSPSGIPAVRYNFFILASSILLFASRTIDWIVPAVAIFTYSSLLLVFSLVPLGFDYFTGDILFGLLTSGVFFSVFFVLPDTSTMPRTVPGKTITGLLSGFAYFILCGPGGASTGSIFAIIIVNTFTPMIERIEKYFYIKSRNRS